MAKELTEKIMLSPVVNHVKIFKVSRLLSNPQP